MIKETVNGINFLIIKEGDLVKTKDVHSAHFYVKDNVVKKNHTDFKFGLNSFISDEQIVDIVTIPKISELMQEYLDNDEMLSGPSSKFTGRDFNAIKKVVDETSDNFVVFNNSGGKLFEVWHHSDIFKDFPVENFEEWVHKIKGYVYMYKINGKETILKKLK